LLLTYGIDIFLECELIIFAFFTDEFVYIYVGSKYHKANDAVRIILHDGSIKSLSEPNSVAELTEEGQEMCQYVSEVS